MSRSPTGGNIPKFFAPSVQMTFSTYFQYHISDISR